MGKMSRDKGAAWEREVARVLRAAGVPAKRGLGQARSASEVADVQVEGWWIEAKVGGPARYPLKALEQATRALIEAAELDRKAVAICKQDRKPATATFLWRLGDYMTTPAMVITTSLEDWIRIVAAEHKARETQGGGT